MTTIGAVEISAKRTGARFSHDRYQCHDLVGIIFLIGFMVSYMTALSWRITAT